MMRRWRGADVSTEREYTETRVGCGKNLLRIPPALGPATGASAVEVSGDGYTVSVTGSGAWAQSGVVYLDVIPGKTYTASVQSISGGNAAYVAIQDASASSGSGSIASVSANTPNLQTAFAAPSDGIRVVFVANGSGTAFETPTTATFSGVMIEEGNTATEYEPYEDIPFLALDNAQGQIESVAVEAGCRARQAGTGDPSPENIRAITGRASVEIAACGKNLLPRQTTQTKSGVTIAVQADGGVHISGTCTAASGPVTFEYPVNMTLDGEFTLSMGNSQAVADHLQMRLTDGPGNTLYDVNDTSSNIGAQNANSAVTLELGDQYVYGWLIRVGGGETYDVTLYPQLEAGGTATAFEPYRSMGGGTVTPTEPLWGLPGAEDTVEVSVDGDVTVTRRTAVLKFDGTEYWIDKFSTTSAGGLHYAVFNLGAIREIANNNAVPTMLCSHYAVTSANAAWLSPTPAITQSSDDSGGKNIRIMTDVASLDAWKSYLAAQNAAGTPVTIVYELATPTTETPVDVDPIVPEKGQLNIFTDADALSTTVHGSGWDTISDQTGLLATIAQLTARVAALKQAAVNESTGG